MLCNYDSAFCWCIFEKCKIICVVCVCHSFCGISSASCLFLVWNYFLLLDLSMSKHIINIYGTNISSWIQLRSRALWTLTAISVKVTPLLFSMIPRSSFFRKERMQTLVHFSIEFCLYTVLHNSRSKLSNFLVFHASGSISSMPAAFLRLIFQYFVNIFLLKLP